MNERPLYSLLQLTLYFLKLGSVGFGGPVALVGYMYRDLVEGRRWIAEQDYKEGLTLAQLMQAAFYGVGAAVIGIIAVSAYKLTVRNIGKDRLLWAIYLATAVFTVWTESESVWLFLGGGVL